MTSGPTNRQVFLPLDGSVGHVSESGPPGEPALGGIIPEKFNLSSANLGTRSRSAPRSKEITSSSAGVGDSWNRTISISSV